ncbi:11972_t:CDS:2, partial [Cetraspora pellucida]
RYLFDYTIYEQFKENVLKVWEFAFLSTKELGLLALTHSQEQIEPSELNNLAELEQMLKNKKTSKLEEEKPEHEDNSYNLNNDLLSNYIHPVVDSKAK